MRDLWRSRLGRATRGMLPAAVIALGLGSALLPDAAQAQFFGGWGNGGGWGGGGWGNGWGGGMGPGEISQSIAQRGFRVIAPLRRNGNVFVADVVDRRGRRERLIVASGDAEILQRSFLDDPGLPGFVPRRAMAPRDDFEQPSERADRGDLVPPGSIPNGANPGYGNRAYGNQAYGSPDETAVEPVRPRTMPKVLKPPRPRTVERSPDVVRPQNDAVPTQPNRTTSHAKPSDPLRLPGSEPGPTAGHPAEPSTTTASRPIDPVARPSVPSPSSGAPNGQAPTVAQPSPAVPPSASVPSGTGAPSSARMSDPLAIPGRDVNPPSHPASPRPASTAANSGASRVVPGTVTGAPASPPPASPSPAKSGDVPAAPLD